MYISFLQWAYNLIQDGCIFCPDGFALAAEMMCTCPADEVMSTCHT